MQKPSTEASDENSEAMYQADVKSSSTAKSKAYRKMTGSERLFPGRLHDLMIHAEEKGLSHVISWVGDGKSFTVHDPDGLVEILPLFFSQTKYRSFRRQLNMWSFERRTQPPLKGSFSHPYFLRGEKAMCLGLNRDDFRGVSSKHAPQSKNEEDDRFASEGGSTPLSTSSEQFDNTFEDVDCKPPAIVSGPSYSGQPNVECGLGIASQPLTLEPNMNMSMPLALEPASMGMSMDMGMGVLPGTFASLPQTNTGQTSAAAMQNATLLNGTMGGSMFYGNVTQGRQDFADPFLPQIPQNYSTQPQSNPLAMRPQVQPQPQQSGIDLDAMQAEINARNGLIEQLQALNNEAKKQKERFGQRNTFARGNN